MIRALISALLLASAGCATPPAELPPPDRNARRASLTSARTFAAVLSSRGELDRLSAYDVVLLDPDPYNVADLRVLRQAGTLALGYVNVGEAEDWRSFADDIEPGWVLGENPNWPGHRFVDAREPGWQRLVVDRVAATVVSREFDGFFLDMTDVAAPSLYPETAPGVVATIQALRDAYPTHVIVMNRGLFLTDAVGDAIDGLVVEGVWARQDFAVGGPVRTPDAETVSLLDQLAAFRESTGGAAFTIEYADTDELKAHVARGADAAGLPVYVGDIELGRLPDIDRRGW